MVENKIVGYKKVFGFVLPDWFDEHTIKMVVTEMLVVVVMLFVLIFFVWPNYSVITARGNELKTKKAALLLLNNSKEGINRLQTALTLKEQDAVMAAIPTLYSPEISIYMLRTISNDSGVVITSYKLPAVSLLDSSTKTPVIDSKSVDMVSFKSFPIRLSVVAPVDYLLSFIAKIEASLPFGVVSDLNLQEVTELAKSDSNKSVELDLEIMFYQANLGAVNLNKVLPLTDSEIALAKTLSKYNLLSTTQSTTGSDTSAETSGDGNVFGF